MTASPRAPRFAPVARRPRSRPASRTASSPRAPRSRRVATSTSTSRVVRVARWALGIVPAVDVAARDDPPSLDDRAHRTRTLRVVCPSVVPKKSPTGVYTRKGTWVYETSVYVPHDRE